jgi:hypothetical protein
VWPWSAFPGYNIVANGHQQANGRKRNKVYIHLTIIGERHCGMTGKGEIEGEV